MPSPRIPRRRRPVTVMAVAVLIVVALVLFVVAQVLGGGSKTVPPRDKPTPKAAPTSSSSCNLPDGNQTIPTKGPAAEWVLVASFATPRSKEFGPGQRGKGVGSCFAHNPSGALFAVANFTSDLGSPSADRRALGDRFFDDTNKKEATAAIAKSGVADNRAVQIAAFRFGDYTRERATLELVLRMTEGPHAGQYASITVTVGWQNGDWRIVTPPSGKYPATALTSVAGYTKWGA